MRRLFNRVFIIMFCLEQLPLIPKRKKKKDFSEVVLRERLTAGEGICWHCSLPLFYVESMCTWIRIRSINFSCNEALVIAIVKGVFALFVMECCTSGR